MDRDGGRLRMVLFVLACVMTGCDKGGDAQVVTDQGSLRSRTDAARGRLWVLGLDDVRVYDVASKRLIRQIVLPGWSVARFICHPDMVLDRSGTAIVSSNVQTRLWRIDADSFDVKEHEIVLLGRERWDTGFGALAPAADGTLFAVTSSAGSLWRIDVDRRSARMIEPERAYLNTCELTPRAVNDLERRHKP